MTRIPPAGANETPGIEALLARYADGDEISFGPRVALVEGILQLPGGSLPLNTIDTLSLDDGNVLIRILGSQEAPVVVPAAEVDDTAQLVRVTNRLVRAIPYLQRRSVTGWPPGSIGDLSVRVGTDVRELLIVGYTDDQIRGVLRGEYTLDELRKQRPKGKRMTLRTQKR
jgi:hypothetical protein